MIRGVRGLASLGLLALCLGTAWRDQARTAALDRELAGRARLQQYVALVQHGLRWGLGSIGAPGASAGDGVVSVDRAQPPPDEVRVPIERLAAGVEPREEQAEAVWAALHARAAHRAGQTRLAQLVEVDGVSFFVFPGAGSTVSVIEAQLLLERLSRWASGGEVDLALAQSPGAFPLSTDAVLEGSPVIWASVPPELDEQQVLLDIQPDPRPWLLFTVAAAALSLLELGSVALEGYAGRVRAGERQVMFERLSHSLRTPAASVRTLAGTLSLRDLPPDEQGQLLAALSDEAERLVDGTERLLRAARGDGAVGAADRVPIPVAAWLEGLAARWQPRLRELRTTLPDRSLVAALDPDQLEEAVDALLDNALRYGTPPVTLSARVDGAHLEIAVEDSGDGVAEADRRRIFRKLERGARGQGFGLGLWAADEVARAHGGTLSLAGASRFTLRLPVGP